MMFRDFLYLDRPLVRTFLAQAEGGEYDEITQRQRTTGKGGFGVKAGTAGVGASAEKAKESAQESELVMKQSAASEFDRFYSAIEDSLPVLDAVENLDQITGLRRKQFVEVDARLSVAGFQSLIDLAGAFASTAEMMEPFGVDTSSMDSEAVEGLKALAALNGSGKPLSVIASVPGGAGLKVALDLDRSFVSTEGWDTDASVLLKIQRFIKDGDRYIVGDPFGGLLKLMPEENRKAFTEALNSGEAAALGIGDIELGAPAIVGTAVAIYR